MKISRISIGLVAFAVLAEIVVWTWTPFDPYIFKPSFGVRLERFGAHPDDGKCDDKAINAAISYVDARGGGVIFMSSGTYDMCHSMMPKTQFRVALQGSRFGDTNAVNCKRREPDPWEDRQ